MKIVGLKTYVVGNPPPYHGGRNWLFLKLKTDSGIEGYGEAYAIPFHPEKAASLIEDVGERLVIGSNPFDIEKLWRTIYGSMFGQHPDMVKVAVISAFEMACWDIIGKELNQPVHNLIGGKYRERVRSYTYLYAASGDPTPNTVIHCDPEKAAERAAYYVKQGFTAVKFDPILDIMSPYNPQELSLEVLDRAEAVVRSVREAVGSKCELLIGTHGQPNTYSAIRLAKRLEKYEPLWFEEPVPPENVDEMARVARSTSIPIATGERLSTFYEFANLIEKQAASIIQMSLGRSGGILMAKKIAAMAEVHYCQIAPHLYCGPIEEAANIQLDISTPNLLIQETIETCGGFHAEILKEPLKWEDGYLIPSSKPGLGVELNEEVAAKHPCTEFDSLAASSTQPQGRKQGGS
jgi:2-dehydro-3-deoxyphosphogalactonate aldolase